METRTTESDRCFQEFRTDAGVASDRACHFIDIGSCGFAEGRNRVDRRDALGEEGVGNQFGQLGRPEISGDDFFARNPVGINRNEGFEGSLSFWIWLAADEDAVRVFHVCHRGALGKEFRVGENLESGVAHAIGREDRLNGGGRFDRDGGFLDDDLVADRNFGDQACCSLDVTQVCRAPSADSVGLGGRTDANKDEIRCRDGGLDVGGEVQVLRAC